MPRLKKKYMAYGLSEPTVALPVPINRDFMNVVQAADYLGCKVSAIRIAFQNGLVRKRVGSRDIVRRTDLDTYFNSLPEVKAA
jgi:hypothetical protein